MPRCAHAHACAQETLDGRLDSLKGGLQALTGHGAGVSFSNGATYVSDGQCTVVIAGEPHTETLQEADDGLNEKQARGLRAARLGAAATVPVPVRPPAQRLWKALSDPFLRCSAAHFRLISLSAAHTNFPSPAQRVAWALLGAYAAVADAPFEEMQSSLLKGLSAVTGSFALVMHDRVRHRVVAARDKSGGVDLLWGLSADAALIFSTTSASAIGQAVNPQMFPAGCCFVSDVDANAYNTFVKLACPGSLTSFARAAGKGPIPRANSSSGGMCRIMSGTDLAQITSKMGRVPSFTDLAPAAMRGAAR